MGIKQTVNRFHWSYFIALEQDLTQASRFIEFTEKNYSVFSIELAHILLATASEVDVILKDLCNIINEDKTHENINDYKETIKDKIPNIINEVCYIPRFGLELQPWSNWNGDSNPNWWRSYNNVKHQRNKYFEEANLKHALNSLAALNIIIIYYYQIIFEKEGLEFKFRDITSKLNPESSLFKFKDEYYHSMMAWF